MSQNPLPTDQVMPTATTLYNYDTERDSFAGLLIQKDVEPCTQTDPAKYQDWRTDPLASDYHINGTVEFNIWLALKDFQTGKSGYFNVCIRDKNGGIYTTIIDTTVTLDPEDFDPSGFVSPGSGTIETYDIEAVGDGTMQARITITQGVVKIASIQIQ